MNSTEYRELLEFYNEIYEEVGVKTNDPEKTLQKMIDRQGLGGKVISPPPSKTQSKLQNASYQPNGEQLVEVDLFDYILEHLVSEGYADTNEAAIAIMANMSGEWKEGIIEGIGLSIGASKLAGRLLSNPRTSPEEGAKNFQKNLADPVGNAVKGAAKAVLGVGEKKNKEMSQKRRPN